MNPRSTTKELQNSTTAGGVRVRCPGCGNIVEVVMLVYTLIHNCEPCKYQAGEIVEILPPDPKFAGVADGGQ